MLLALLLVSVLTQDSTNPTSRSVDARGLRTIAIDEVLADKAHVKIGDRVVVSTRPNAPGDTVIVAAIVKRSTDPSEVAREDLRLRMHLDQLQTLADYGDRVDRFAIATPPGTDEQQLIERINNVAFGFKAYRSRDIAVETSRTFQVVSRFHRAIGIITIVASSVFLLCIMVLKVEERRRDIAALRLMGISRSTVVRAIILEAALIAVLGSALGILIGWLASLFVNWHYQALYRTPLAFSIVTTPIIIVSVLLSLVLGIAAGIAASLRLVRQPPLALFGR
ncbi:MAG TPA: FtsX-like permease family protein [Gemmatimonadaceae bacterium]|nr:FtsX-like permease family protein [Gemmatimonadaceae bacterium]